MSKRQSFQQEKANYIRKHGLAAWRLRQRAKDKAWEESYALRFGREALLKKKALEKAKQRARRRAAGLTAAGKPPTPGYEHTMGKRLIDGVWHPPGCPCYDCLWGPKLGEEPEAEEGVPVTRALLNVPNAKHYNHWRRHA